jgi:hypothetical protein
MTSEFFTTRPMTDDDIPFVVNSWALGYYFGNRVLRRFAEKRVFVRMYSTFVVKKLKNITVTSAVSCAHSDQIYAYVAYEPLPCGNRVLHYIYTKEPFRRCGIATRLLSEAQIPVPRFKRVVVSHWTEDFFRFWRAIHKEIPPVFMPWIFTEPREATDA